MKNSPTSISSKSVEETKAFAASVAHSVVEDGVQDRARIIALSGELGAGKTVFAKGFAKALGIEDIVTSPTFIIERIYLLSRGPFKRFVHIDAYRLESAQELSAIGWDEIVENPENIVLIEWPERVGDAIPQYTLRINFKHVNKMTRDISYA